MHIGCEPTDVLVYGDGRFGPSDNITCEQLVVIFYRYAEFIDANLPAVREYPGFKDDALTADYAKPAVKHFYEIGIITGTPDNLFDPGGTATRAEVAAPAPRLLHPRRGCCMLHRFIETVRAALVK